MSDNGTVPDLQLITGLLVEDMVLVVLMIEIMGYRLFVFCPLSINPPAP